MTKEEFERSVRGKKIRWDESDRYYVFKEWSNGDKFYCDAFDNNGVLICETVMYMWNGICPGEWSIDKEKITCYLANDGTEAWL